MKEKILKNGAGITLVALVVTIVVLLILAGITITYVMGDNSIFNKASNAKLNTELAKIEEQAGIIYANKLIDQQAGKISEITNEDIIDGLQKNGNIIEIRNAGEYQIERIKLEPATISIDKNETAKIKVKIDGTENNNIYYAVIQGKYYKMHFINSLLRIEREATDLEGDATNLLMIEVETEYDSTIVTNVTINQNEKTLEILSGTQYGNTGITVKYGGKIATCNVTVEEPDSNWEEINKIAKAISESGIKKTEQSATVTVDGVSYTINVGDEYKVRYGGKLRKVRVLGFNHDILADTGAYKTIGKEHTTAGISFEFVEFMLDEKQRINAVNDNTNGWKATTLRKNLNGENVDSQDSSIGGYAADLSNSNYIKKVNKPYLLGNGSIEVKTDCNDWLWLLSCAEIWTKPFNDTNSSILTGTAKGFEGSQYAYYTKNIGDVYASSPQKTIAKYPAGKTLANSWWCRSTYYIYDGYFCYVTSNGIAQRY